MAREYEMAFRLNARLSETFRGTFNSAQRVLSETEKEIQKLNKSQSDIAAYQRQQNGIDKSTKQLDTYKHQLEITQNALSELRKSTENTTAQQAQLASKEVELKNRISNTEQAIADKNQKLQQMAERLNQAGIDTNRLGEESERLKGQIQGLAKQEEEAAKEAANLGAQSSAFDALGAAITAAGIATAVNKMTEAFAECNAVAMEFESTMSTVEALSGANALQMNELAAEAKRLGAETVYTANQSAQAMTYMGMAGWDAGEMLSGMDGMISLAAASGEDLALVSDIVTDNLTAFGLKASDTAHFADVLAQAASKSNTSVASMGETFSMAGAVAGALGYSIEDVSVAVGLMANSGVKGSVAGTALKNMFNGLLNGATLTAKAFGEVEFSAINADGTIDTFSESMNELRGYFDQMTEAERVQNAMLLAGQRGYNGLLAILNSTEEDYNSLTEQINSCTGAAKRMADIKLDNLKGDVTLLDSATDGLKMTIGDLYNNELRRAAQAGTEIISGINEFCEENPAVVKAIMAIGTELGIVVTGYTAFAAIKKVSNALAVAGIGVKASENGLLMLLNVNLTKNVGAQIAAAGAQMQLNAAMLANPVGIIVVGVAALTAGLIGYNEATKAAKLETLTLSTATQQERDNVQQLNDDYQTACERWGEADERTRALKYDLDEANASLEAQSFSVSALYAEIDSLHSSTTDLLSSYYEGTNTVADQQEEAQILSAKLKEVAESSETAAHKEALMEPIIGRLNQLYPSLGLTIENVSGKLNGLSDTIDKAAGAESLQAKYKAAQENRAALVKTEKELKENAEQAEIAYEQAYFREKNFIEEILDYSFVGNIFGKSDYTADLKRASEARQTALEDLRAVQAAIAEGEEVIEGYRDVVEGESDRVVTAYDAVSIAVGNVTEETTTLLMAYNDAYQAALESVGGQYNLWTQAEETIPTSIGTINTALESQTEYWDNYNYNLEILSKKKGSIEGLGDVIATFADGSKESVNVIAGMADASDDELKAMVKNFEEQKKAQQEVAKSLAEYRVDINEQMEGITADMESAVEKMELSDEAEAAAKSTIDAYTKAILAGKTSSEEAAALVARSTAEALAKASVYSSETNPSGNRNSTQEQPMLTMPGISPVTASTTDNSIYERLKQIPQYASGTDYAQAGYALVGEQGPEIVLMHGGEKVIDAVNTKAIMESGNNTINVSPSFVINGNASEVDVRALSDQLIELVKDALSEAGIDRKRSAYA